MSYFDEYISKTANAEDQVRGAFWEGVFGCELIEDEGSLLTCLESMLRFAEREKYFESTERLGQPERPFSMTSAC